MTDTRETTESRRGFLVAAGAGAALLAARPTPAAARPHAGAAVKARVLNDTAGGKIFVLVLDTGDEVVTTLTAFVKDKRIAAGFLTGVGGFGDYVLGFFDHAAKDHRRLPVTGQVEVLSLTGDVAMKGDEPMVRLHAVVGLPDGTTRGGRLLEAHVWPTLEVVLTESPKYLSRRYDPDTGLALIRQ